MSARTRFLSAAVATATLIAGGAAVAPAMAAAAPASHTGAPALPLSLTVTRTSPNQVLTPNGAAATATITVTNSTSKTQQFTESGDIEPNGSLTLTAKEVTLRLAPLGATPKSLTHLNGPAISIPAHTTYVWKATVEATKAFPRNDVGFKLRVAILAPNTNPFTIIKTDTWFHVGPRAKAGAVVETLKGGTTLGPRHPAYDTFTVTNRTGARIAQTLNIAPLVTGFDRNVSLAVDEWVGSATKGHWQQVTRVVVPSGLADNASYSVKLRFRVTRYASKAASVQDWLQLMSPDLTGQVMQFLTVNRNG